MIILLLSILGFLNAYYLHHQYKQYISSGKQMFCLIGGKCADVISSKYGQTFGIKNEVIGMTYYVLLVISMLINILIPQIGKDLTFAVLLATILATIFSIYLLFVQTFILKKLCSWCLIAIAINIALLFLY